MIGLEGMQGHFVVHGGGMMATTMRTLPSVSAAIFAAGVSNSQETSDSEYSRERNELEQFIKANITEKIIYFSSYVAAEGVSRYADHKREVEALVEERGRDFLILRLPQVVGRTTNRTLVNYLVGSAINGTRITLERNAFRSLLDVVDVGRIVCLLIERNVSRETVSVGPPTPISVLDIVRYIESILQLTIERTTVDRGDHQGADLSRMLQLIGRGDPICAENYQYSVLKKYVPVLSGRGVC